MAQFVGDGGGDQTGRGVHVHIGLASKGEVHSGKAQNALQAGAHDGLGPAGVRRQTGELRRDPLVQRFRCPKPAAGVPQKAAVLCAGHLIGQLRCPPGVDGGDLSQFLHGVGGGRQAAALLKAGGVIGGVPQPAGSGPQPDRPQGGQTAQTAPPSLPPQAEEGEDQPNQTAAQKQSGEQLPHGEGEQSPQPAQGLLQGGHASGDPGGQQTGPGSGPLKQTHQCGGEQQRGPQEPWGSGYAVCRDPHP